LGAYDRLGKEMGLSLETLGEAVFVPKTDGFERPVGSERAAGVASLRNETPDFRM
jgi:hypothetical protein